jgi:hypothetical protein
MDSVHVDRPPLINVSFPAAPSLVNAPITGMKRFPPVIGGVRRI